MSTSDWLITIWFVGAIINGLLQAVENQRVFYVFGPPSAFWVGVLWPVHWTATLILLVVLGVRRLLPHRLKEPASHG